MPIKYPIQYDLTPKRIDTGRRWLTLSLKNVSTDTITGLNVRLNTLDVYSIDVYGIGSYISDLEPDEEHVIPFQVSALTTGSVYASLDGWKAGEPFHWESPGMVITVGQEVADLVSLFALTEPYPPVGEKIRCEANIRGLMDSSSLTLEFWVDTPSGDFEEVAIIETKELGAGEDVSYAAEITPGEKGSYTIYAYLYDGARRIGRQTEYVYVTET